MKLATDIADAVVTELAGGSFSVDFTPQRKLLPQHDLRDTTDGALVTVVPSAVIAVVSSRSAMQYDVTVDVAVQQHLTGDLDEAAAPLFTLVQEIADHMRFRDLAGASYAHWFGLANEPIYSQEHLRLYQTFTGLLRLQYRVIR